MKHRIACLGHRMAFNIHLFKLYIMVFFEHLIIGATDRPDDRVLDLFCSIALEQFLSASDLFILNICFPLVVHITQAYTVGVRAHNPSSLNDRRVGREYLSNGKCFSVFETVHVGNTDLDSGEFRSFKGLPSNICFKLKQGFVVRTTFGFRLNCVHRAILELGQ